MSQTLLMPFAVTDPLANVAGYLVAATALGILFILFAALVVASKGFIKNVLARLGKDR